MHIFSSEAQASENQSINHSVLSKSGVFLDLKREDQIHKDVSGNKFRKLKYNLIEARNLGYTTVLTFGGAYSNHIAATAAAGKMMGLQTIGIIRGEELANDLKKTLLQNSTLRFATSQEMKLSFVTRAEYREKASFDYLERLKKEFGPCYIIPEGGTNPLAIRGCEEILTPEDITYDIICCAVGTGGTISGIINSTQHNQMVLGFPALKGDFLNEEIKKYTHKTNWKLVTEYHFGGYGKINQEEVEFINKFYEQQSVALDPVYTAKMIFGIFDLVKKGVFKKNTRILAIHTGGLQGIDGMNEKLKKKKLPLIRIEY